MTQENAQNEQKQNIFWRGRFFSTRNITLIAMMSALSAILYNWVKFPMPFLFPSWLEIQFSDLPILIASFLTGPVGGLIVTVVRFLLKILIVGSGTGYVGELADVLVALAFVLPASFIYMTKRTKKSALIGIAVGVVATVIMGVIANWLILIPFYFADPANMLAGALKPLFPNITPSGAMATYLFASVAPFNLLRAGLCGVITYFVYKPLSRLSANVYKEKTDEEELEEEDAPPTV